MIKKITATLLALLLLAVPLTALAQHTTTADNFTVRWQTNSNWDTGYSAPRR
jgi:hypothetical protein